MGILIKAPTRRTDPGLSLATPAANGDMPTADFTGLASPTGDPRRFLHCGNRGHHRGTGRFADATGSFKVERSFDFATNSTAGSFEGDDLLAGCETRFAQRCGISN